MKGYTSETIRNVAVVGHSGCGKTTFWSLYWRPVRSPEWVK